MPDTALTTREFDKWSEADSEFKKQLREHIQTQIDINLHSEGRLAALEEYKNNATMRVGVLSSLVSAVVGGIVGLFSGRAG